jgi:amicoumacin kinase
MEKYIHRLLDDSSILQEMLKIYGLEKDYRLLGDFENFVYEVRKGEESFILRLTHQSHRSYRDIAAEIDWLNYLFTEGIHVPKVIETSGRNDIIISKCGDGSEFYACLFSKAPGRQIKVTDIEFDSKLFWSWGKIIGQMHEATARYKDNAEIGRRPGWDEEDVLFPEKYVPEEGHERVIENSRELINMIKELPMGRDSFGLVHTDLHSGNFFFDGKQVHPFDFDDCAYHWFASDIAIPVYYSVLYRYPNSRLEEKNTFASGFLKEFAAGYGEIRPLPPGWQVQLPLFLKLRDVVLYTVLHKKIAPEDRSIGLLSMMAELKGRIEAKQPIFNLE